MDLIFDEIIEKISDRLNDEELEYIKLLKNKLDSQSEYRKLFYIKNKERLKSYAKQNYIQNKEDIKTKMLASYYKKRNTL